MNLTEFKAWFEGYTEEMEGSPTKKQWAKIQEKVAGITSNPTSYPVFIEKYRDYYPWLKQYYSAAERCGQITSVGALTFNSAEPTVDPYRINSANGGHSTDVLELFRTLGLAEAKGIDVTA